MDEAYWLREWCQENVNFTYYDDDHEACELARRAELEAKQEGIFIVKALEEEGYSSLKDYMLDMLNKRLDEEISYRIAREKLHL